jgi:hypothetical protein
MTSSGGHQCLKLMNEDEPETLTVQSAIHSAV